MSPRPIITLMYFIEILPLIYLLLLTSLKRHWEAIARSHGEQHLRFDRMARNQAQGIALGNCCQHQLRLHERKRIANALTRPTSEGEIGEAWATNGTLWREAFRVEALRVFPKRG